MKSAQITKVIEQKLVDQNRSEKVDDLKSEKDSWYEDLFVDETHSQEEKMKHSAKENNSIILVEEIMKYIIF